MRVFIRDDYESLSLFVANYIKESINQHQADPVLSLRPLNIAFSCGFSVQRAYKMLAEMVSRKEVSFSNVVAWHVDEFVGVPRSSDRAQINWMYENLYAHVDLPPQNVRYPDAWAPSDDYAAICAAYDAAIASAGGLDLSLFGTGADGHVARNEPGSSLQSVTRLKMLAFDTRITLSERWRVPLSDVPTLTLTMGVKTITASRDVLVIFTGVSRSRALQMCLEGCVNHMFPVSALQSHPRCCFVADEPATYELRVKTVSYFKGIERTSRETFGEVNFMGKSSNSDS